MQWIVWQSRNRSFKDHEVFTLYVFGFLRFFEPIIDICVTFGRLYLSYPAICKAQALVECESLTGPIWQDARRLRRVVQVKRVMENKNRYEIMRFMSRPRFKTTSEHHQKREYADRSRY